jgi:hypothetical protein
MARRLDGSVRAAWMEVGTGESDNNEVTNNVSLSAGSRKPRFTRMVIRSGLTRGATGMAFTDGDC